MEKPKEAAFSLKGYYIPEFSYNERKSTKETLKMSFNPTGLYNEKTNEFQLTLIFIGFESEDEENSNITEITKLRLVATFKFSEGTNYNDIPDYFYPNSIAIVFPFIRSFLASITLQANAKMILLDLMNLNSLAEPLKENTALFNN